MQLIFGLEHATQLREKYTVLALETLHPEDGVNLDVFCVLPSELIVLMDPTVLKYQIGLHNDFGFALSGNDNITVLDMYPKMIGQFNGELDTFYTEIYNRLTKEVTA